MLLYTNKFGVGLLLSNRKQEQMGSWKKKFYSFHFYNCADLKLYNSIGSVCQLVTPAWSSPDKGPQGMFLALEERTWGQGSRYWMNFKGTVSLARGWVCEWKFFRTLWHLWFSFCSLKSPSSGQIKHKYFICIFPGSVVLECFLYLTLLMYSGKC